MNFAPFLSCLTLLFSFVLVIRTIDTPGALTARENVDFTPLTNMQVTFTPMQPMATVDIMITTDIIFEADEQFRVELYNPDIAEALGDINKAIVTIYDDDSEASKFALI